MQFLFVDIIINNGCIFRDNKADVYPGIYMLDSAVTMSDTIFERHHGQEAAFIRSINSYTSITRCSFTEVVASSGAVMSFSENSELELFDSNITNIFSSTDAAIYFDNSEALIDGLTMTGMYGGGPANGMIIDKSTVTIQNSHFKDSTCTMLLVHPFSDLKISDSTFKNSTSTLPGGFIYIDDSELSFDNVEFENGVAPQGGALYYGHPLIGRTAEDVLDIKNSKFTNNTALVGGAVLISADLRIIENTEFIRNSATDEENEGTGGAI